MDVFGLMRIFILLIKFATILLEEIHLPLVEVLSSDEFANFPEDLAVFGLRACFHIFDDD